MAKPKRLSLPVTLTMRPSYFQKADAIMEVTGETLSQLTRRLIFEEWERQQASMSASPSTLKQKAQN